MVCRRILKGIEIGAPVRRKTPGIAHTRLFSTSDQTRGCGRFAPFPWALFRPSFQDSKIVDS